METLTNLKGNLGKFQDRDSARRRNDTLKKTSSLYKLHPFLDKNGLLRIGGRIRRAEVPLEVKHPLILPKKSHISDLIVRYFHESVGHHQGRGVTHNTMRQAGYWIVDGRSTVARTISKCVTCRRFRGQLQAQKMSDLPEERVTQAAPFHYTGIWMCWVPFTLKTDARHLSVMA